jgi:hypothetical protein
VVLGTHFIEEEGDDLVAVVRGAVAARGSTYVFVGTPDRSRRLAPHQHAVGDAGAEADARAASGRRGGRERVDARRCRAPLLDWPAVEPIYFASP